MRKLHLVLLLPVLAVLPALWEPVRGQGPIQPQVLYARQRQIAIPFDPDPAEAHRLKQLQLYYSSDQGRTWQLGATAAPDQRKFNFLADGDGFYLFTVQTTDNAGRSYPEKMDGATPGLRVVIDTVPPVVNVKPVLPRGNEVGVAWEITDANPDLASADAIRLEYRAVGNPNWLPLYRVPGATQHYWAPGTTGALEVRLRARDLAGNSTEATTQVGLQGNFGNPGFSSGGNDAPAPGGGPAEIDRKFVNTRRISLNYEITKKGPSGISGIDLWFTTDGRSWSKFNLPKNAVNDATFNGPLTFDVQNEGLYGFTLVPRSGVGISPQAPQVGDKPQVWIEVDTTKPAVELQSVLVGTGDNKGKLSISWAARDKNLAKTPISLSYANSLDGTWTPFASNIANTGRYVWAIPPHGNMPWQFYIKVEAIDMARNIGEAITPGLVKVDTMQPELRIIDVLPGR